MSWWTELPLSKKIAYTAIGVTVAGAAVGAYRNPNAVIGALHGAGVGFMLWGAGAGVYTAYHTARTLEAIHQRLPG